MNYKIANCFLIGVMILVLVQIIHHGSIPTSVGKVVNHAGPDPLYPDYQLTPGKADTLNYNDLVKSYNGQTYSQAHRAVSSGEKTAVCKEYPENCKSKVEIDHFYPLCAGGSNDIKNLWAQPEVNMWNGKDYGYRTKDKLETYICREVKAGRMSPQFAFDGMTKDWIAFYVSLNIENDKSVGGVISNDPVE